MQAREFSLQARITTETLEAWLEAEWLVPQQTREGTHYTDIDLARAHLINDLRGLGINDEGVPVVLDLVDQIHGLRRALRELLSSVEAQAGKGQRK